MKSKCITLRNISFSSSKNTTGKMPILPLSSMKKERKTTKPNNKALYLSNMPGDNKLQFIFQALSQNYPDNRKVKRAA